MNCKFCGNDTFIKYMPTHGVWVEFVKFVDGGIKNDGGHTDLLISREPKTMECQNCGKRNSNPGAQS